MAVCLASAYASLQVASQQNAVSQKLHMLETHQKETHDSLVQMERTAITMYQVTWMSCMCFADADADADAQECCCVPN